MDIIIWSTIFIISIFTLGKSANYFTYFAEKLGIFFKLPSFVVGITIVSIGTSLPELVIGALSAFRGGNATSLVAGNIVGANISNILFVVGIASVVAYSIKVRKDLIKLDLPLLALATSIFILLLAWDRTFSFSDALIALAAYGIYLWYVFRGHESVLYDKPRGGLGWKVPIGLIVSALFLWVGAKYAIDSVLTLGSLFNVSPALLALTVMSFGTTLPELFVTVSAVRKKQYEVAIGNIFGSNIVNVLFVVAIPALIAPLIISTEVLTVGIPFLIAVTLLYIIVSLDREVHNYEGAMFLLIYIIYILMLFTRTPLF